jgi:hypothetical protein
MLPTLDMPTLLIASTVIDVLAVAALAWLVLRAGRGREAALEAKRDALDTLRADLAELIADAERRAQALEETLGAREKTLRALVGKLERPDTPARPAASTRATTGAGIVDRAGLPELARKLNLKSKRGGAEVDDPAEARLLRDLELAVGSR